MAIHRRRRGSRGAQKYLLVVLVVLVVLMVLGLLHHPTGDNEEEVTQILATSSPSPLCGSHGSSLIDQCLCDPGYDGPYCNVTVPIRNAKCRFNPDMDICWNTAIGRFRASSRTRKEQANQCEQNFWETTSVPRRNIDQIAAFNGFKSLPTTHLGHVLEVGAGPYTKTRLLLETRTDLVVTSVTLVDPLLNEYQSNPKIETSYTDGNLKVRGGEVIPTTLMQASGEDALPKADTVILVNTLEHCFNAVVVLNNIYQALKPGGVLLFGESFATELQLQTPSSDSCHPIQLRKSFLLEYLSYYHPLLSSRTGDSIEGIQNAGAMQSVFAIVLKRGT